MMCNLLCCRWDRHAHAESERVTLFCFYSSMFSIISSYFNINTFLYVQAFGKSSVENKLLFQFSINVSLSHSHAICVLSMLSFIINCIQTSLSLFELSVCLFNNININVNKKICHISHTRTLFLSVSVSLPAVFFFIRFPLSLIQDAHAQSKYVD